CRTRLCRDIHPAGCQRRPTGPRACREPRTRERAVCAPVLHFVDRASGGGERPAEKQRELVTCRKRPSCGFHTAENVQDRGGAGVAPYLCIVAGGRAYALLPGVLGGAPARGRNGLRGS